MNLKKMDLKKIIAGSALALSLLAPGLNAQESERAGTKKSLALETMLAPRAEESHTFRLSGLYGRDRFHAYGFLDVFGSRSDNYYGELHARRSLTSRGGLQLEINDGRGLPAVFRSGLIFDLPTPRGSYLSVKVLPLNVSTEKGLIPETQIGTFGRVDLAGFYAENWTDYNLSYSGDNSVFTEFSLGKNIRNNLSVQGQAAYNTNSPGWAYRLGARHTF